MPELPEVETIKLGLQKKIIGLKITKIEVLNLTSFLGNKAEIEGRVVSEVWRRAKVLGIDFTSDTKVERLMTNDTTLLFHLKMSGQIIYQPVTSYQKPATRFSGGHPTQDMLGQMPNKSTRVIIYFNDYSKLYFNDQRKFGWIKVVEREKGKAIREKFLDKLGPEPLEKEFTVEVLNSQLQKRKNQPVKVAILDQEVVAGVGNIYAAEAVFLAKLDPRKKVKDLTEEDFTRLHQGIVKSLSLGVKYKGSSSVHFVNEEGQRGYFLDYAYVYGRENLPCKICQTILTKIKLGGRGTVFCEVCQK